MSSSESRKGGKLSTPEIGDKPHQPSNFHFPQHEFGKTSVVKRSFNIIGSKGGHGSTMMKNKILRFVLHVLLPTRIIPCIISLVWRKRLFPLASQTGYCQIANTIGSFFFIILSVKAKWFCLMF